MGINLDDILYDDQVDAEGLALENLALRANEAQLKVYVLLTDTGTTFSKISKAITGDPYNHVSIMFDYDFDHIYTFSMSNGLKRGGGFMKEDRKDLNGARYSLYSMDVTPDIYDKMRRRVDNYFQNISQTTYNHFGLINAILNKGIFKDEDGVMICSQFVASIIEESGVKLFKDRLLSTIRPYEFVKSKLLKYVERGTIKL